jgi:OmpA-OmpF porin, OOP family
VTRHLLLAVVILSPSLAAAEPGGDIDLQAFRPAMDSRGFITVDASQVLGPGELSFGLVTTWGRNLLAFEDGDRTYRVENIITPTLVTAVGLRPFGLELELGGALPFGVMSGDRGPDSDGGTPGDPNDDQRFGFTGQGVGDASVQAKLRLADTSRRPLGVALIAGVRLPTASAAASWIGDGAVIPELGVVVDRDRGRLRFGLEAGVRLRPDQSRFVDDVAFTSDGRPRPMTGGVIGVGSTIPFGAALSWALSARRLDLVGEVYGQLPLAGTGYLPVEAIGGLKVYLAESSFLTLGAGTGLAPGRGASPDLRAFIGIVFEPGVGDRDGDGLKDDVDRCPDDPEDHDGFEDADGCPDPDNDRDGILDVDDLCPLDPEDHDGVEDDDGCPEDDRRDRDGDGILDVDDLCPDDPEDFDGWQDEDGCPDPDNDGDGILDVDDLCPDDPEDFDGWQDEDGCPDPDNDGDGILDVDDDCPNEPENFNGFEDDDGCPDRDVVRRTGTHIDILKKIYFEYDSAVIKQESYSILDAVAYTIAHNPDLRLIEIQGHTDERGSDAYNLALSQARAEAVRDYLVEHGQIAPERLEPRGYGERVPKNPESNQDAWAENRRVEFVILRTDR